MRHVVCQSCGKRYNYDEADFCPKCGSYNQPEGAPSTRLEREQLARFEDGRPVPPPRQEAPSARPQSPPRREPVRTVPQPRTPPAFRSPETPVPKRRARPVLAVVVIIGILIGMACAQLEASGDRTLDGLVEGYIAQKAAQNSARALGGTYAVGEPFPLNSGVEVQVDEAWWVLTEVQEGDCLAVEVWITGGTRQDDLRIEDPALVLDGASYLPLDDISRSRKLAESAGLYPINLRDYQWEDPLYGQFVFFLPEGSAGEAELIFPVYAPGRGDELQGEQTVRFTLP